MSIPVKINNVQVLSFDIVTDDINVASVGNISSEVKQQNIASLCVSAECYNCNQTECNEIHCSTTKCTQVKCTQVKCNQVRCNTVKDNGYDSYCDCNCNDN